jgi:hypothetical protein
MAKIITVTANTAIGLFIEAAKSPHRQIELQRLISTNLESETLVKS